MIKETGAVIITEDDVLITDFVFDGVNMDEAQREALEWAESRLGEVREEVGGQLPEEVELG